MERRTRLRRLCACEELSVWPTAFKLLPWLFRQGLSAEDAIALGYNTALLYLALSFDEPLSSPEELFSRLSLGEIALLCEEYESILAGDVEYGVNESFPEVDL